MKQVHQDERGFYRVIIKGTCEIPQPDGGFMTIEGCRVINMQAIPTAQLIKDQAVIYRFSDYRVTKILLFVEVNTTYDVTEDLADTV